MMEVNSRSAGWPLLSPSPTPRSTRGPQACIHKRGWRRCSFGGPEGILHQEAAMNEVAADELAPASEPPALLFRDKASKDALPATGAPLRIWCRTAG